VDTRPVQSGPEADATRAWSPVHRDGIRYHCHDRGKPRSRAILPSDTPQIMHDVRPEPGS
jgi:hypothetical protein